MMDSIIYQRKDAYLAPVMRVDCFTEPRQRRNVELNFERILNHPLAERFAFVTPGAALQLPPQPQP